MGPRPWARCRSACCPSSFTTTKRRPVHLTPLRSAVTAAPSRERRESRHGLEITELLVVADVQPARIAQGLEIPRSVASRAQRLIDEVTTLLARNDIRREGGQVPSPLHVREKLPHARRVTGNGS